MCSNEATDCEVQNNTMQGTEASQSPPNWTPMCRVTNPPLPHFSPSAAPRRLLLSIVPKLDWWLFTARFFKARGESEWVGLRFRGERENSTRLHASVPLLGSASVTARLNLINTCLYWSCLHSPALCVLLRLRNCVFICTFHFCCLLK